MSNFAEPRDRDELEGTLLPVARAVPANEPTTAGQLLLSSSPDDDDDDTTAIPVTAATPVSYFAYPTTEETSTANYYNNNHHHAAGGTGVATIVVQEAPAVPLADSVEPNDAVLRAQIAHGERSGRIDNDSQLDDIQRANRKVHSINYFTRQQVQHGNQRASRLSQEENRQGWRGPRSELSTAAAATGGRSTTATSSTAVSPSKENSTKPKGYGKEYDVAKYDVKEYDTRDYQISEYKSMYDS